MSSTQQPILLADGDPGILAVVGQALTTQGYEDAMGWKSVATFGITPKRRSLC